MFLFELRRNICKFSNNFSVLVKFIRDIQLDGNITFFSQPYNLSDSLRVFSKPFDIKKLYCQKPNVYRK